MADHNSNALFNWPKFPCSSITTEEKDRILDGKSSDERSGITWFSATLILSNVILGSGLLNYPDAYSNAGGIWKAVIIQLVMILFIQGALCMLAYCSSLTEAESYQDTIQRFAGRPGLITAAVLIAIHNYGACATYLVVVSDQIDKGIMHIYGPDFRRHWYFRREFTLPVATVLIVLPMLFKGSMGGYKIVSALAVLGTLYIPAMVLYEYLTITEPPILHDTEQNNSWIDSLRMVSIILFSFDCHVESVPIFTSLKRQTVQERIKIIAVSVVICFLIYNIVGVIGYITYGQSVKGDIFTNFVPMDTPVLIGMGIVAVKYMLTYPPRFFCVKLVFMDAFLCGWDRDRQDNLVTLILFAVNLMLALVIPNITAAMALLGGTAALIVLSLPGFCFMKAHLHVTQLKDHLKRSLGFIFVVVGVFLACFISANTIRSYIKGDLSGLDV